MQIKFSPIILIILSITLLLSSCTQQIINNSSTIYLTPEQQQKLSEIPLQWELKGRLSIIQNEQNWHARFHWIKQANQYQLRFTGPLGETHLLLEQKLTNKKRENSLTNKLTTDNEVYTNTGSMDELLLSYSGMAIPIESLQYWIFGHYNPDLPYQIKELSTETDISGSIKDLFQEDWQIQFSRYVKVENNYYPAKIIANNSDYKIKVFISSRSSL